MDAVGGSYPSALALGAGFLATAVTFGVLDFIWIGFVARDLYMSTLQPIMAPQPRILAAALFYTLYVIGLVYFAVIPGIEGASLVTAALNGAFLGALAYATYDLTNLATVTVFTWTLAFTDIAWGMFASGAAATVGALAGRAL